MAARCFGQVFGVPVLAVESLAALRAGASATPESEQIGVPMRVPEEVERLFDPGAGAAGRPVRA
jgi:hypothetical protein